MKVMDRAAVEGLALEYELRGAGAPVVLIHWGVSATWAEPLLEEPALRDRHRLLSYHRAGFGGSSPVQRPVTMADHARHCVLLMRQLGIERAHIVGHSSSVAVALQLALDAPDAVHTVVAMDAARPAPETELQASFRREFVDPAVERYRAGDKGAAVDTFFRGVFGPAYRDPLEQGLPGALDQAVSDADTFFTQELPALWQHWSFTEEDARRITQPVLLVVGEKSAATFPERQQLLRSWLPRAELFELPGATHLLHVENPRGIAEGLASFFERHPISAAP
jgi:pimeloyl-ACP methyl ester carboxylesterase